MDGSQRAKQMAGRDEERAPGPAMFPQPEQRRTGSRKTDDEFVQEGGEHTCVVSARPAVWTKKPAFPFGKTGFVRGREGALEVPAQS